MDLRKPTKGVVVAVLGVPGSPNCKWRVKHDDSVVLVCPPNEFPMPGWTTQARYGTEVEFLPTSVARAEGLDFIGKLLAVSDREPFVPQWQKDGHSNREDAVKAGLQVKPTSALTVLSEKAVYDRVRHRLLPLGQKVRKHRDDGTYYTETTGSNRHLKRYGLSLQCLANETNALQDDETVEGWL